MLLGAAGRISEDLLGIREFDLQEAAREGFTVLNVIVSNPSKVTEYDVWKLKQRFEAAKLLIGQTNGRYGGVLVSHNEEQRSAGIDFVKRMCGLTAILGAPNTYLRPGSLNPRGAWFPHKMNRSPEVFDRLVDSTKKICRTAEDEGVKVAVEGGIVSPLYSAKRVRDFIDAVGSNTLGFNQDPVNFVSSLEDVYDMESFLKPFFSLLGDVTLGAHAKDFRVVDNLLIQLEEADIGSGMMDHGLFLREMQNVCPSGHVLIEHIPPAEFSKAIKNFKTFSDRAGIIWGQPTQLVDR